MQVLWDIFGTVLTRFRTGLGLIELCFGTSFVQPSDCFGTVEMEAVWAVLASVLGAVTGWFGLSFGTDKMVLYGTVSRA